MKFKAVFSSGGQIITNTYQVLSIQIVASDQEMKSRLKNPNEVLTNNKKDVIQQILNNYPDAMNIALTLQNTQNRQSNNSGNGGGAILILVAIIFGILFAPFLLSFAMFGKLMFKGTFKPACGYPEYKKLRKLLLILSYVWFVVCVALFIVFGAVLRFDPPLNTIPFYALFFGNLAFVILAIVGTNRIKKAHKDDASEESKEIDSSSTTSADGTGAIAPGKEGFDSDKKSSEQSNRYFVILIASAAFCALVLFVFSWWTGGIGLIVQRSVYNPYTGEEIDMGAGNAGFILDFAFKGGLLILLLGGLGFTFIKEYLMVSIICLIGTMSSLMAFMAHLISASDAYPIFPDVISLIMASALFVLLIICFIMCLKEKKKTIDNK